MKKPHWSAQMKNKHGKTVTVGDHQWGKKMAAKRKQAKAGKK